MRVNLYVVSFKNPVLECRAILETELDGCIYRKNVFCHSNHRNDRRLQLEYLQASIQKIKTSCDVYVYSNQPYLRNVQYIANWRQNNWLKSNGVQIMYPEYWSTILEHQESLGIKIFWKGEDINCISYHEFKKNFVK